MGNGTCFVLMQLHHVMLNVCNTIFYKMRQFFSSLLLISLFIITVYQPVIAQMDSTQTYIRHWKLSDDFLRPDSLSVDTFINAFQRANMPVQNESIVWSYLGNLGSAAEPAIFFDRKPQTPNDFLFFNGYQHYMFSPHTVSYYKSNKPYSQVYYFPTQKKIGEENLQFVHSQNINNYWSAGLRYKLLAAEGLYPNQKTKDNALAISSAFTKHRYSLYFNAIWNNFKITENGGVTDTTDLEDYTSARLENAQSLYYNLNFFAVQSLNFGDTTMTWHPEDSTYSVHFERKMSLNHIIEWSRNHRVYEDETTSESDYYENFYYGAPTYDSVFYSRLTNRLMLQFNQLAGNALQGNAGAGYDILHYYNFQNQYIGTDNNQSHHNLYVLGTLFGDIKQRIDWEASGQYYLSGYNVGDLLLKTRLKTKWYAFADSFAVDLDGHYNLLTPGFFENTYYSNHFVWENNFERKNELAAGITVKWPRLKIEAGFHTALLTNFVYFNENAVPQQADATILVAETRLKKRLKMGPVHWNNTLILQQVNKPEMLPLPELALRSSLYYQNLLFSKVLLLQAGIDVFYNTAYFARAYMPATGLFHVQNNEKYGNYPLVNGFINLKLKKVRMFFKFIHLNTLITQERFYPMPNYPADEMTFKFGIGWRFDY